MDDMSRQGGDFDYETHGANYGQRRRADPRIAAQVRRAWGEARTVLNVGAGAGSYEPDDRWVLAVEPSRSMRSQRPATAAPAIEAFAESLPLDDACVDAAMATITVHQWSDPLKGLAELRRVSRGPVVVLTFDGDALDRFWLADYAPEVIAVERRRYPAIDAIASAIGSQSVVDVVPVPIDCVDGFTEAFYARPERLLEREVRQAQSAWGFVDAPTITAFEARLAEDLMSGRWDDLYGDWRTRPTFAGSLRLVTGWR
jgi:SAM-dependent methyltransferase